MPTRRATGAVPPKTRATGAVPPKTRATGAVPPKTRATGAVPPTVGTASSALARRVRAAAGLAPAAALLVAVVACSRPPPPRDSILFDHGPHLSRGATCSDCHAGAVAGTAARGAVPADVRDRSGGADTHSGPTPAADARDGRAPVTDTRDVRAPATDDRDELTHAAGGGGTTTHATGAATHMADDPSAWTRIAHPSAGARPLLPTEAQCRTCHDDPERDRCATCHSQPLTPTPYEPPETDIVFDHGRHEAPGVGRCVTCHAGDALTTLAFEPARPTMASCTGSCHQEEMRQMRCAMCHTDLHGYGIDDVALLDHGPGFLRRHGVPARADSALCTQCHDPSFCEDCHLSAPGMPLEVVEPTAVYRDFVHRGDFLSRHGLEADLERGTCARCHGTTFCDDCHRVSGVGGGVAPGSPHPPGWLDPLSAFGHARAARRDLLSCVSCHEADAETTCVPCHRVGGVAGSPHPAGFGAGMDPLAHGVCRACHVMR